MESETLNPYGYLEKAQFTSELFKIEIKNLPPRIGHTQLKNKLKTWDVVPHKMKLLLRVTFATFKSAEERDDAIVKVTGKEWKGNIILAKIAAPRTDPFHQKRLNDEEIDGAAAVGTKVTKIEENDDRTLEEKLKDHVVKFWRKPYDEQLVEKSQKIKVVLMTFYRRIKRECLEFANVTNFVCKVGEDKLACPVEAIVPSPIENKYRNKCEFTIGMTLDGQGPIAGFCHGKYRGGVDAVGDASCLPIVPEEMRDIVNSMTALFEELGSDSESPILPFMPANSQGHLRGITVRLSVTTGQLLLLLDIHPQTLTAVQLDRLGDKLLQHADPLLIAKDCSVMLAVRPHSSDPLDSQTTRLLRGPGHITETLMGLSFRISYNAFFQVNTAAANRLYDVIRDLLQNKVLEAQESGHVTLLDVCCGTGTIGLAMADIVSRVIGVEMVPESVEDAKFNAELNGISNAEFRVGKAEDVLDQLLFAEEARGSGTAAEETTQTRQFVAIMDPPRGGLHSSVIHAIRKCRLIKKVIYVSCNPEAAVSNLVDLCRPISKRMHGDQFVPQLAIPVDLFPHTPHVEMVMLLSR